MTLGGGVLVHNVSVLQLHCIWSIQCSVARSTDLSRIYGFLTIDDVYSLVEDIRINTMFFWIFGRTNLATLSITHECGYFLVHKGVAQSDLSSNHISGLLHLSLDSVV